MAYAGIIERSTFEACLVGNLDQTFHCFLPFSTRNLIKINFKVFKQLFFLLLTLTLFALVLSLVKFTNTYLNVLRICLALRGIILNIFEFKIFINLIF